MAPFDAALTTKISPLIDGQVPDFIQADHPEFVKFLQEYYQFLESGLLVVDGDIDNIVLESPVTQNILLDIEGGGTPKLMAEVGAGSKAAFIKGETITGGTSKATATVLIDDISQAAKKLIISANQRFIVGETITGGTSGATGTVVSYRGNPVQNMQQLLDYSDPDNTVSAFLDQMHEQLMQAIPFTLATGASKRDLIKSIRDLYTAKGTSEGHKLFLRLMFDEESEVFYPTKYMLRLSDGNWKEKDFIRAVATNGSRGSEVIGQILTGKTSGATAFIADAEAFSQGTDAITEFEVQDVNGTFINGETITADSINEQSDGLFREMSFTLQQVITGATVNSGGALYSEDDLLTLESGVGNGAAVARVDQVNTGEVSEVIIDTAGSGYRVGEVVNFTTTDLSTSSAEGFISAVGGSFLLEDTVDDDDYLIQEDGSVRKTINNQIALNGTSTTNGIPNDEGDQILLEGTDGSSADENDFLLEETDIETFDDYYSPDDRFVLEDGSLSSSEKGSIARVFITEPGSGYVSLPELSITTLYGSNAKLLAASEDIGQIKSVKIVDAGFRYGTAPEVSVPANFVVKDVTGTFGVDEALTGAYEGTVKSFDSDKQVLSVNIQDVVRTELEQNDPNLSFDFKLEQEGDVFQRVQINDALDSIGDNLITEAATPGAGPLAVDAVDNGIEQITLEYASDFTIPNQGVQLETVAEDNDTFLQQEGRGTFIDRGTGIKYLGSETDFGAAHTVLLEGSAVGSSILIEDGGTDGSGTNAGDEILLDRTTAGGADAGDKVLQSSVDEGSRLVHEDEPAISNTQTRKDYLVLDEGSGRKQVFTEGGWLDEARATTEKKRIIQSQIVTTPSSNQTTSQFDGESIILESGEGDYLVLDGSAPHVQEPADSIREDRVRAARGLSVNLNILNENERILLEGEPAFETLVPHESVRFIEAERLVFNQTQATGDDAGDGIVLEGPDGLGVSDNLGFYTFFENETVAHGGESNDRLISEASEGLAQEGPYDSPGISVGAGAPLVIDAHITDQQVESDFIVMNASGAAGDDEGGHILYEEFGSILRLESGGDSTDTAVGDKIKSEVEPFLTGDISLDGTDDSGSNAGDQTIGESGISFRNTTIQTAGASAKIVSGSTADIDLTVGFKGKSVGAYSNVDSLIDEDVIRIQDSYYYQDFSYELKIGQSVTTYIEELKRAVHPAGFQPFGKVTISSLMSATLPAAAGDSRVDPTTVTFSPVLASVLGELFELPQTRRLDIPEQYVEGAYNEQIVQETGTADGNLILDGTNYGFELESGIKEAGVISSEESEDEGDNIMLDYDIDTSNVLLTEAGDNMVLDRTTSGGADAGDKVDLEDGGYAIEHVDNDNLITDGVDGKILLDALHVNNGFQAGAGFEILLENEDGSILSDTASEIITGSDLVLNGTDKAFATGRRPNLMLEDGDNAGGDILTTAYLIDGGLQTVGDSFALENSPGSPILLESGITGGGVLMSERAAGAHSSDRDLNFIRILKSKISLPQPRPVTDYGLPNMVSPFSDAFGVGEIQLEDALRKRGPTVNVDKLVLDGHAPYKDDEILYVGEGIQLETASNVNIGAGISFKDFTKFVNDDLVQEGGDNLLAEDMVGGKLKTEDIDLASNPITDFVRPSTILSESSSLGFGNFILLDGSDNTHIRVLDNGSRLLDETGAFIREEDGSYRYNIEDDTREIGFLLEQSLDEGYLSVESQTVYITLEIGIDDDQGHLLEETDGDKILGEKEAAGTKLLLEKGTGPAADGALLLDSVRISVEDSIDEGTIPEQNRFNSSYFRDFTTPTEISTRPYGFLVLQDEYDPFDITLDGTDGSSSNAGDHVVLNQTDTDGTDAGDRIESERFLYDPFQQSGFILNQDGTKLKHELGTASSLVGSALPFLPPGAQAETFDNTARTTFDTTLQTFDVLEGV